MRQCSEKTPVSLVYLAKQVVEFLTNSFLFPFGFAQVFLLEYFNPVTFESLRPVGTIIAQSTARTS